MALTLADWPDFIRWLSAEQEGEYHEGHEEHEGIKKGPWMKFNVPKLKDGIKRQVL